MRILWIEDEKKGADEEFFPESILNNHKICQKQKFDEVFEAISNEIIEYDFVVLDLNLSQSDIKNSKYAERITKKYNITEEKFEKEAGYHLAVELIVKFPTTPIIAERVSFVLVNQSEEVGVDQPYFL